MNPSDEEIADALRSHRRIAVVGISPNEDRPSHGVTRYLIAQGYDIVGVNPGHDRILDRPCHPTLADVPGPIGIVDVFRRSDAIPALVDEVLALRPLPKVLWLQLGITHPEAEEKARRAGMLVVSDRCILVEHRRLRISARASR